jgi:hypothetical protein
MTDIIRLSAQGFEVSRNMDVGIIDEACRSANRAQQFMTFVQSFREHGFTQNQLGVLVAEIRALSDNVDNIELRDRLEQVILFVRLVLSDPHERIAFETA